MAIHVCDGALTRLVNPYADTYQGLSARIFHRTGNLCLLG